jgi:Holliday junction DNA helicase RuvA
MISLLQGKVISIDQQQLIIQVSGIGFQVLVARPELYSQEQEVNLPIYMHWNQEQGPSFFGFSTELEKKIFLLIISCSGIGPKIGLALLGQLSSAEFLHAVQSGNDKALSAVNGIGAKKAEQIVVQLRDKVTKLINTESDEAFEGAQAINHWNNISQVLKSLNYSRPEIESALAYLRKEHKGADCTFDQLMRSGLSFLAKRV